MTRHKITTIIKFLLYIFPAYFVIALLAYSHYKGVVLWEDVSTIPQVAVVVGVIFAGIHLIKGRYRASMFMILMGATIIVVGTYHDFIFQLLWLYGGYVIVHFSAILLLVFLKKKFAEHK